MNSFNWFDNMPMKLVCICAVLAARLNDNFLSKLVLKPLTLLYTYILIEFP